MIGLGELLLGHEILYLWPNIGLQATANSLRSYVAAAIGGA
jgi:hypothetical protein